MIWKDREAASGDDTFGNLLACCLQGGDTPTAIKICELLKSGT